MPLFYLLIIAVATSIGYSLYLFCTHHIFHMLIPALALEQNSTQTQSNQSKLNTTVTINKDNYIKPAFDASISIITDKIRYTLGETIIASGAINSNNSLSFPKKVTIMLEVLPSNSMKLPNWLNWLSMPTEEKKYDNSLPIVYTSSFYTNNTTFSYPISNTETVGTYRLSATLAGSNEKALTTVETVDPLRTISAIIIYIGGVMSVILIFILSFVVSGFRPLEITSFIILTIIVITPLLALLLSDTSLGPNSPIGLVIKHPTNEQGQIKLNNFGQPEQGGQWMLNVGGSQHNNYSSGIQIPIFVVVFGIIGGYLRFLYERATVHTEKMTNSFDKLEIKIAEDNLSTRKFKEYLELPISYRLKKASGNLKRLLYNKNKNQHNNHSIEIQIESDMEKEILLSKNQFRKRQRQKIYLDESLRNLSLLLLSPLLAICTWFLLVQIGLQDQQNDNGRTGIFILAVVSFSVGLVTNEIVQYLMDFVKKRFEPSSSARKSKNKND
jgi:hypothetical protein